MAPEVNPLGTGPVAPRLPVPATPGQAEGPSFKDLLYESINEVNRLQQEAQTATESLVTGRSQDVGQVLIASQKADIAFKMLMEVRNKLITAYDELRQMRM